MSLFGNKKKRATMPADGRTLSQKELGFTAREQYKLLRTNLVFTLPEGEKSHIIGITSASHAEGKSTTAINLSYSLAEAGKKVLLIDGDLRLPSIAKKLGLRNTEGLTQMLMNADDKKVRFLKDGTYDNFFILPSGKLPPNPSELLASNRMARLLHFFAEHFEYIIIDLPPINVVSDALALAGMISGILLVVHEDVTSRKELDRSVRQIRLADMKILGFVLTNAKKEFGKYSSKYKKYKERGKNAGGYGYGAGYGYGYYGIPAEDAEGAKTE